jgi:hypothetical protein
VAFDLAEELLHERSVASATRGERSFEASQAKFLVGRIASLGQPVGVEEQRSPGSSCTPDRGQPR